MRRREFLQAGLAVAGAFALGSDFWRRAYAAPARPGPSPFGPLGAADVNGLLLPEGFTSRVVATSHQRVPLAGGGMSDHVWHRAPDGGGVFPQPDGGWIYVSNSEIPILSDEFVEGTGPLEQGGVGAIRFDADGNIVDAYPVLQGTNNNCAGGVTPWGTWLSCEENFGGWVYECDPTGLNLPIRLLAMGQFNHEAAAVDPVGRRVYLTEDAGDGAFYRFTPLLYPDLTVGLLEVLVMANNPGTRTIFQSEIEDVLEATGIVDTHEFPWDEVLGPVEEPEPGPVTWAPILELTGVPVALRYQVPTAAIFKGGEGCWYDDGFVYWTCKGSNRVWALDTEVDTIDIVYDAGELGEDAPLTGVDNIVVHPGTHDLYVAEDGGNMELVVITSEDRTVAPMLRYPIEGSEIAGPAFDESGTRLYFASQAKRSIGEIFEVTGPFDRLSAAAPIVVVPPVEPVPEPPSDVEMPATGGALMPAALAALTGAAALGLVRRTGGNDERREEGGPPSEDAAPPSEGVC